MTTQHPQGSDETADLVRSIALSSARLWEDFLERLAKVEQTQLEITEAISSTKGGAARRNFYAGSRRCAP